MWGGSTHAGRIDPGRFDRHPRRRLRSRRQHWGPAARRRQHVELRDIRRALDHSTDRKHDRRLHLSTARPPGVVSRQFCDEIADLLDQLVTAKQQFVICGDFNCPGTDGGQLDASLVDVPQQYDVVQHVADATRGDNTPDLMVTTSDDAAILTQDAVHPTCFSDHRLVTSRLHVPVSRGMPSIKSYRYRDLQRVDLPACHEDIRRSPPYEFDVTMTVDDYVDL